MGKIVDDAMVAIERDNPRLKGVLPKDYARPSLDKQRLGDTYHAWRGDKDCKKRHKDVAGFCKSAKIDEIRQHDHVLTPGRYVGAEEVEDDGEPFDQKMRRLVAELNVQFAETRKLEKAIRSNLEGLGYGG